MAVKRLFYYDKIGYTEYTNNKISVRKTFYGHPQYYQVRAKNAKTGEYEVIRLENAIYSWRDEDNK